MCRCVYVNTDANALIKELVVSSSTAQPSILPQGMNSLFAEQNYSSSSYQKLLEWNESIVSNMSAPNPYMYNVDLNSCFLLTQLVWVGQKTDYICLVSQGHTRSGPYKVRATMELQPVMAPCSHRTINGAQIWHLTRAIVPQKHMRHQTTHKNQPQSTHWALPNNQPSAPKIKQRCHGSTPTTNQMVSDQHRCPKEHLAAPHFPLPPVF